MDMYGLPKPELFRIDDLLNLSNEDLFSSTSASSSSTTTADQFPPSEAPFISNVSTTAVNPSPPTDFLCVPSDEVAELEWLSQFVDDSFTDFPSGSLAGALTVQNNASFPGRSRSKRSRATTATKATASMLMPPEKELPVKPKREAEPAVAAAAEGGGRRCTHCASEKTPQWRTGPLGPKTLCNACGVRFKSGRLVPEYRPAASPTFVLTQHSNSHRKVLELRRQKEMQRQQQQQQQQEEKVYRHQHDFKVS